MSRNRNNRSRSGAGMGAAAGVLWRLWFRIWQWCLPGSLQWLLLLSLNACFPTFPMPYIPLSCMPAVCSILGDQSYFRSPNQWISIKRSFKRWSRSISLPIRSHAALVVQKHQLICCPASQAKPLRWAAVRLAVSCSIFAWPAVWIQCFDRWLCWTRQTGTRPSRLNRHGALTQIFNELLCIIVAQLGRSSA